jgi:DNA-binding beta-propeller fold protein YncE
MLGIYKKALWITATIAVVTLAWGCGGSTPANVISVVIFPTTPTVLVNGTVQFQSQVSGSTDRTVTWTLNDKPAGDTMTDVGKISVDGLYTAPAKVPTGTVTVKATANADKKTNATATITVDSGIRVTVLPAVATIGTGETFTFRASVTNDPTNSVTWSVKETNAGTIDKDSGVYTAPNTVPTPATATIVATSKIDTTRTGTATVTIVTAQTNTFSGISPTKAPQGGLFQDVYLNVTNLRSTSKVLFKGVEIDRTTQLVVISDKLARLRLLAEDLATAGTFPISVDGATVEAGAQTQITIIPVRPAIVEAVPDSAPQTVPNFSINVDGGYFGTTASPAVSAEFNNKLATFSVSTPRRLTIGPLSPGEIAVPGLYSVALRSKNVADLVATTNFAVQPSTAPTVEKLLALGDGAGPSAIAIDTVLGRAIVANKGTNSVQLLDVTSASYFCPPGVPVLGGPCPITATAPASLAGPVSVGVDEQRHIALVVNSGDNTVSIVNLITGGVTTPFDLKIVFGQQTAIPAPAAVGVEPNSGLALVAYKTTNTASILKIDATNPQPCLFGRGPLCVVGAVTLGTGADPQIAVDPRLKWAFVTPGGGGPLSVVDLGQQGSSVEIATDGAKRVSNVVTITTKTAHNLNSAAPTSVAITNVTDASFSGTFSVTSVPTATTFTYNQTAPNASSGGGQVGFGRTLLTFAVGNTIRGIVINPVSARVLLTDVNSNLMPVVSELDQTSNSVDIGHPALAAAFNQFTNLGVVVKPNTVGASGTNTLSLIDPTRTFINPSTVDKPGLIAEIETGGQGSSAVAVDPGTNRALVANSTSNNVSFISLGSSFKSLQISQIVIKDPARQLIPNFTLASDSPLSITVNGAGFGGGSVKVRLDGTEIATVTPADDRHFELDIPASFLAKARRYSLEVVNGVNVSNSIDLTVVKAVDMKAAGCTAPNPSAVAIDANRDLAIVANTGCDSISLVDLNSGTVLGNQVAVGKSPEGVAVLSRAARAVVTNNGSENASIVDITDAAAPKIIDKGNIGTGKGPLGVAINQDTGVAVVTNTQSNSITLFDAVTGGTPSTTGTSQIPLAVSIDPTRNIAVVANSQAGVFDVFNLNAASASPSASLRGSIAVGGFGGNPLPTSVVFDAATGNFLGSGSLGNQIFVLNPDTGQSQSVRVGVNPTSLAYNFQSSTLVTINTAGKTISVVNSQLTRSLLGGSPLGTTAVLGIAVSPVACSPDQTLTLTCPPPSAVDIHPRTNLAVVADQAGNRILLLPLPR